MALTPIVADSLERVGVTVALTGASLLAVEAAGWELWWAPLLVALLNGVKVVVAAQFGDPQTGGFYTPPIDEE
jgi:hypothetical protein